MVSTTSTEPMNSGRRLRSLLALFVCLLAWDVTACIEPDQGLEDSAVVMYPSRKLNASDEWTRMVSEQLGCGSCERYRTKSSFDEPVEYIFNRSSPMVILRADIREAKIVPVVEDRGRSFMLVLTLSESGRSKFERFVAKYPNSMTVNEIGGKLVGLRSLSVSYDQYFAAELPSLEEMQAAIEGIGFPAPISKPIFYKRRRDQDRI